MQNSKGFSFIELLMVVATLSVVLAIAAPVFNDYKQNALRARVQSMTADLMKSEEAYFSDNEAYLSCTVDEGSSTCSALPAVGELNFTDYSAILLPGSDGIMVAACHERTNKGYAYITDPAMPFYDDGRMIDYNLAIGECSLAVYTGL